MKKSTLILIIAVVVVVIALIVSIVLNIKDNKSSSDSQAVTTKTEESKKTSIQPVSEADAGSAVLKTEVLKEGTGDKLTKNGDTISVHYTGTLADGTKFDSSLDRGEPFSFVLGASKVIKGWDQGLIGMKVGEKIKLTIPPSLGYGSNAVGKIPADSTLIFEVELLSIK